METDRRRALCYAGGKQWLGKLGGLYDTGEQINTYYQRIFEFVASTQVYTASLWAPK